MSARTYASLWAAMLLVTAVFTEGRAAVPTETSVAARLRSVTTLVESSSGARQVQRVGAARAVAARNEARALLQGAVAARNAQDLVAAADLLDRASRKMFEAIRLSDPGRVHAEKAATDFERRRASTRALQEALLRVAKEKSEGADAARASAQIDELLDRAERRQGTDPRGAAAILEQAYLVAKAAVAGLRAGDTLVRTLEFANEEEEYAYEIDRNDTHRMLIDVLLSERRESASVDRMVTRFVAEARMLREQAEAQAAVRRYDEGIDLLERSTRALVRAIRGAGVYIPG